MVTIGVMAGAIYAPPLLLLAGGWVASRVSSSARRWIAVQLFQ